MMVDRGAPLEAIPYSQARLQRCLKDLERALLGLSEEYRADMGISDYLRARLSGLPGIETATSEIVGQSWIVGGGQVIKINGVEVHVGNLASDNEIERAIRSALNMPDTDANQLLPVPALVELEKPVAQPAAPVGKPIPSSGGYTPGSLKTLLQGLQKRSADVMSEAVENVQLAHKALDRVAQVGVDAKATADSIMAEIGQFSNHPDDE